MRGNRVRSRAGLAGRGARYTSLTREGADIASVVIHVEGESDLALAADVVRAASETSRHS